MPKTVVGVMGPGSGASETDCARANELGGEIARAGWVLLSGGRDEGVMDAASRGAKREGGLTVGILPSIGATGMSQFIDIPIVTGMGEARNNINVLSSQVVFVCGMGPGTASEAALALKAGRHVVLLEAGAEADRFFTKLDPKKTHVVASVREAVDVARHLLDSPV
jgi:uncharacterized protein (TIGR00725 family)